MMGREVSVKENRFFTTFCKIKEKKYFSNIFLFKGMKMNNNKKIVDNFTLHFLLQSILSPAFWTDHCYIACGRSRGESHKIVTTTSQQSTARDSSSRLLKQASIICCRSSSACYCCFKKWQVVILYDQDSTNLLLLHLLPSPLSTLQVTMTIACLFAKMTWIQTI